VIQACEQLATRCEEARQAVIYFTNNAQRMKYDQFRAATICARYFCTSGASGVAMCKPVLCLPADEGIDGADHASVDARCLH